MLKLLSTKRWSGGGVRAHFRGAFLCYKIGYLWVCKLINGSNEMEVFNVIQNGNSKDNFLRYSNAKENMNIRLVSLHY